MATEIIAGGNPTDCKWDSEKLRPHANWNVSVRKELTKFPLCGQKPRWSINSLTTTVISGERSSSEHW